MFYLYTHVYFSIPFLRLIRGLNDRDTYPLRHPQGCEGGDKRRHNKLAKDVRT